MTKLQMLKLVMACKKIVPVSSKEYSNIAKRPTYSYLDNTKLKKTFGINIKNWSYYLNDYLKKA